MYVQANLLPGEKIVYRAKLHWFMFVAPCTFLAIAVALRFAAVAASRHNDAFAAGFWGLLGALIGSIALFVLVKRSIAYLCSEFAVTTKRVILKVGLIRRFTLELFINKIDSLSVEQGILGRVIGFGTIIVCVASTREPFRFIANPLKFRRQVQARQS